MNALDLGQATRFILSQAELTPFLGGIMAKVDGAERHLRGAALGWLDDLKGRRQGDSVTPSKQARGAVRLLPQIGVLALPPGMSATPS